MPIQKTSRVAVVVCAILASFPSWSLGTRVGADDESVGRLHVNKDAGIAAIRPYQAGRWGVVAVEISNPTERDATVLLSSSIKGFPHDQHARSFWVPANAVLHSWQHLYIPKTLDENTKQVDIETTAWDVTDGAETLLPDRSGKKRLDSLLPIASSHPVTAVITNRLRDTADLEETAADDAVDACVVYRFRDRRTAMLDGDRLPATATALDGLRHLVLYNDRIADDPAAMTAVRRWLQNGGRLWIMADRVRQETVERLLGDVSPYQTVDRVGLTWVQLKPSDREQFGEDLEPREFEQPVPLVRVLTTGVNVTHTVDGWPASFIQRCGNGRILYTTLGMRAWLRPITSEEHRRWNPGIRFFPGEPLEKLTARLLAFDRSPVLRPERFDDYVAQQIGYEIVSRNLVVAVLAVFCAGLLVTSVWLWRAKRMERMRWIGPGWAITAAAVLTGMGSRSRQSVPETVVVAQLVEVAPDSEEVNVTGLIAVYRQDGSKSTVGMDRGGLLDPEFVAQPGTTRRMLWTDLDRWRWDGLEIPAGVQQTQYRFSANVGAPLRVSGHFGPDGLSGTLATGPFREPADAVVTTSTGTAVAMRIGDGGTFVSGPDQSLPPGVFVSGGLLSDEQRRRQEVYRRLWQTKDNRPLVERPTALVWTQPIDMGLHVSGDPGRMRRRRTMQGGEQRRAGSALLSIPLQLERTPPATRVRIPAAFLPYRRILDPDGRSLNPAYSNPQREWIERSGPCRTWLRVQIPEEVRPLDVDRATITLHFDGPSRRLDIAGFVNGKAVILATVEKPAGEVRIPITRADVLRLDSQGGLVLGIFVGEGEPAKTKIGEATRPGAKWRIQYVFIDAQGTTAPRGNDE
jgi:hypothetical protein